MDLNNFCHNGKWLEILYVRAFFALHSQPSLCESYSTSQILLAHLGPHPPKTMSPDPCLDFSSSPFNHSDHSPPPSTPNPLAAPPDPVPQPPPFVSSSLSPSPGHCSSQCPSPACAWGQLWDLSPTLHPEWGSQGFTLASLDPLHEPDPQKL